MVVSKGENFRSDVNSELLFRNNVSERLARYSGI